MKRQKIIALCGSSRFKKEILREQERLILAGNMVIAPVIFISDVSDDIEKLILQKIQYQKIEMADEILVINKHNYIEESTRLEIQYATCLKKPITYLYERTA